jgi:hypothetical protein
MSSALAMILTAAMTVPGNGPEMVSDEMEQGLDLSGKWEGILLFEDGTVHLAKLANNFLETFNNKGHSVMGCGWAHLDEGGGRCKFRLVGKHYYGIYKQEANRVTISICFDGKGYPTSFNGGDNQWLLILRRVKPRK